MSRPEDFDIVPDDEETPVRSRPSNWLWLGLGGTLVVIVLAAAFALSTFSRRVAPDPPPVALDPSPTATEVAILPSETWTPTPDPSPQASPTPTLTETPTPTPLPLACTMPVADLFAERYSRAEFGCPQTDARIVWSAWQPFQGGQMFWRSDTDQAFVLTGGGLYYPVTERWDGTAPADRGGPPPGLYAPERGFGFVWARSDEIFNALGWATQPERGICARIQDFETGTMVMSDPTPSCTAENLYNYASASDWTPLFLRFTEDGRWNPQAAANPPAASPNPTPTPGTATALTRPVSHGIFRAPRIAQPSLDARFDDWPGNWIGVSAIVHGANRHRGTADLYGEFQLGWDTTGLYFAVRVQDDVYRASPPGNVMWQGDSFEIHFDRDLPGDYEITEVNEDDYQLGVSFGPNLDQIRGYRWYPYALETPLNLPGTARATTNGYAAEFQVPWHVFELDGPQLAVGNTFGFNFSINDNDGDTPAQEKTASASPMRTTHDNPTQWGTLVLAD